jgi:hypothetical protein
MATHVDFFSLISETMLMTKFVHHLLGFGWQNFEGEGEEQVTCTMRVMWIGGQSTLPCL